MRTPKLLAIVPVAVALLSPVDSPIALVPFAPPSAAEARGLVVVLGLATETATTPLVQVEVHPRSDQTAGPVRRTVEAPGRLELAGIGPGVWEIRSTARGWWAPSEVFQVDGETTSQVTVTLWPTVEVVGTAKTADGAALEELSARFQPVTVDTTGRHAPAGKIPCRLEQTHFACRVPAGRWDLRLQTPRHANLFFWDRALTAGETSDLGGLTYVPGASVVGTVPTCAGKPPDPSCRVSLEPWTPAGGASARSEQKLARQQLVTTVDRHGFFQLLGVPEGTYLLTARQDGFAPQRVYPVKVFQGAESELAMPVMLRPPGVLSVAVEPPVTPSGSPWVIELRDIGLGGVERGLARETLAETGRWERGDLTPGAYRLILSDAGRNRWIHRELEVTSGSNQIMLEVPLLLIGGTVRLGDTPLPDTAIWFGGRHRRERVQAWTDDEGVYAAHLPRPGTWDVEIRNPEREVWRTLRAVPVPEEGGEVDLDLPDSEIAGIVVDPDGRPVEDAFVLVASIERFEVVTDVRSDEQGRFRVLGFAYGGAELAASSGNLESETVRVELSEAAPSAEVRLTIRPLRRVQGRVVSAVGRGVPGVLIQWQQSGSLSSGQAISEVDGSFSLPLPEEAEAVDLLVFPPGYAFDARRLPVGDEPLTVVVADHAATLVLAQSFDRLAALQTASGEVLLFFRGPVSFGLPHLHRWLTFQRSVAELAEEDLAIPAIAPGELTACLVPLEAMWPLLRYGDRGASRCRSTELTVGGTTVLDLSDLAPDD